MSEESVSVPETKKNWGAIIEKVVMSVLGFISVWLFTSVIGLKESVAQLTDSRQADRKQWEALAKQSDRLQRNEIETEVNRRVQQALIELMILKQFGSDLNLPEDDDGAKPPKDVLKNSKDLLDKLNKMEKPTNVDDFIQREQMVVPQQKE